MRDLSLADYWTQRFDRPRGNVGRLRGLVFLAERDLAGAKGASAGNQPHELPEVRVRRVLDVYDGMSPLEAALVDNCWESWVRKVRRESERDPIAGRRRE